MLKYLKVLQLIVVSIILFGCSGSSTNPYDSPKRPGTGEPGAELCVIQSATDLVKLYETAPSKGKTEVRCKLTKNITINLADDMFPIRSTTPDSTRRWLEGSDDVAITIVMPKQFNLDSKSTPTIGIYDVIQSNISVLHLNIKVVSEDKGSYINIYAKDVDGANVPKSFGFLAGRSEGFISNTTLDVEPTIRIFNKYIPGIEDSSSDGELIVNSSKFEPPVPPLLAMPSAYVGGFEALNDTSAEPSTVNYNSFGGVVGVSSGDDNVLNLSKITISYEIHNVPDDVVYTQYIGGVVGFVESGKIKNILVCQNDVDIKVKFADQYAEGSTSEYHMYNVGGVAGYAGVKTVLITNVANSYLYLKQPAVYFNFGSIVGKSEGAVILSKVTNAEYHVRGNKIATDAQGNPAVVANIGGVIGQLINKFVPDTDSSDPLALDVYNFNNQVAESYIMNMVVNLDPEDTALRIGGIVGASYDGVILNNLIDNIEFKAKTLFDTAIPPLSLPDDQLLDIPSENTYLGGIVGHYDISEELSKSQLPFVIANIVSGDMQISKEMFTTRLDVVFKHALNFGGIAGFEKMYPAATDGYYYSAFERNILVFDRIQASDALVHTNSPIDTYSVNRVIGSVGDIDKSLVRNRVSSAELATQNFFFDVFFGSVFKVKGDESGYDLDNSVSDTTNYDLYLTQYPILMGTSKAHTVIEDESFWMDTFKLNYLSATHRVNAWELIDGILPLLRFNNWLSS